MRGQQRLVAQRMRGYKPSKGVVVHLSKLHPRVPQFGADEAEAEGVIEIEVDERESFDALDLRPVVGLRVAVIDWQENDRALRALCTLIVGAGASEVMGFRKLESGLSTVYEHRGWSWQA